MKKAKTNTVKSPLEYDASNRGRDDELRAASTVEELINGLPEWGKVYPRQEDKCSVTTLSTSKDNGRDVTTTQHSITTTPDEIVILQPINGFWLGSLIQEKGLVEGIGSFTEVPIEAAKRAAMKITTDLLIPDSIETVNNPSLSTVQQAINRLITRAVQSKVQTGSTITYKMTDNHTVDQTALTLGLDVHYMGASVKASLQTNNSELRRSISAVFIEKAFTLRADFEGRSGASAFFNKKFTIENARKLIDIGSISVDNLPTYLASVTYGRMLIFTITANAAESDIRGAIHASYEAIIAGGTLETKASELLKCSTTEITVTSIGGTAEASSGLIRSGKLSDFFNKSAPLTSMMPISYTINTVRENRLAAIARTTNYISTTYNLSATGAYYLVTMYWKILDAGDGPLDNIVECYGDLRINGARRWCIPRSNANRFKMEVGQSIDILDSDLEGDGTGKPFHLYSDSANPTIYQLSGFLSDVDDASADDTLLSFQSFPLRLEDLAGKGEQAFGALDIAKETFRVKQEEGVAIPQLEQGPARLYVRVDRT